MIEKRITDAATFGKVAVLYGGNSSEREVSLWSGEAVLKALQSVGVDAHGVDTMKVDLLHYLKIEKFDRVFIALHGGSGENGVLQGALEYINMPYTGSGVLASAIGMDKLRTKQIWQAANLPVLQSYLLESEAQVEALQESLPYPLAIKPSEEGSSVGVSRVNKPDALLNAWRDAEGFHSPVFAEPWIVGKGEYTCAVLNGEVLPIIRMETDLEFYDYEAKYLSDQTRYFCPAGLSESDEIAFRQVVQQAAEIIGATGCARVDFVVDDENQPWLLEINTAPGMTGSSLVPMAAKERGIDYATLCWLILESSFDF